MPTLYKNVSTTTIKVYMSAQYGRALEMQAYALQLELIPPSGVFSSFKYKVESSWIRTVIDEGTNPLYKNDQEEQQAWATKDIQELRNSTDVLICFTEDLMKPFDPGTVRGGRHVELGYVIGLNESRDPKIDVWIVGPRENIFYNDDSFQHFDTWSECLAYARGLVQPLPKPMYRKKPSLSSSYDLADAGRNNSE